MVSLEFGVIPITSVIHSVTFASALNGQVTDLPFGAFAFFVGVDPSVKAKVDYCKKHNIKSVAYWIGSDSWCAIKDKAYRSNIPEFDLHICVHERIQCELASWGVKSHVVWPCPRGMYQEQEITKRCVGCYQPTPFDNDIYNFKATIEIAKKHPDLEFLFWGSHSYPDLPKNVKTAGRLTPEECKDVYSNVSCVLRLTDHDGMPVGLAEAKMKGLHVIQNYPYSGALFADNSNAVSFYLSDDTTHQTDKSHWPQFYRDVCSPEMFHAQVMRIISSIL